jgi:MinD superfamily P-loop ATPase
MESKYYIQSIPEIDPVKCTGCGDCVEKCPTDTVGMVDGKASILSPEQCNYCTECETVCLPRAVECPFEITLMGSDSED